MFSAELHPALHFLIAADDIQSLWEALSNTIQQYVTCSVAPRVALIINAERRLNNELYVVVVSVFIWT